MLGSEFPKEGNVMKAADVNAIFKTFEAIEPEPKTELRYTNDFTLLVAIVLSAQATDVGVNKATPALFRIANTPKKMLALGEEGLKKYIKTIGLFNSKARNIIALSARVEKEFKGKIPETRELLQTLPGVGRKTANVWLNCARSETTIAVDTHVLRVSNRIGLAKTSNPAICEEQLEAVIPEKYKKHAHHWLILHGRYVCKARKPECGKCPIRKWCEYPDKQI
jgi:endonuclease-3